MLPFLVKISNRVIQSDYLKKTAQAINSDLESVVVEFEKYENNQKINKMIQKPVSAPPLRDSDVAQETREEKLEERLMEIILRLRKPGKIAKNIDWQTMRFKKIGEELVKMKKFSGSKLASKLAPELRESFNDLYLRAQEDQSSAEERKKERGKIIKQLEEIKLKTRLVELSGIIAHLEASKKVKKIAKIEVEYAQTLKRLAELQRA